MEDLGDDMQGFEQDGDLPTPLVNVEPCTRDRIVRVVAAIIRGATPEEITAYLEQGWPEMVDTMVAAPLEAAELDAHVDLLLTVMQTPALPTAA